MARYAVITQVDSSKPWNSFVMDTSEVLTMETSIFTRNTHNPILCCITFIRTFSPLEIVLFTHAKLRRWNLHPWIYVISCLGAVGLCSVEFSTFIDSIFNVVSWTEPVSRSVIPISFSEEVAILELLISIQNLQKKNQSNGYVKKLKSDQEHRVLAP